MTHISPKPCCPNARSILSDVLTLVKPLQYTAETSVSLSQFKQGSSYAGDVVVKSYVKQRLTPLQREQVGPLGYAVTLLGLSWEGLSCVVPCALVWHCCRRSATAQIHKCHDVRVCACVCVRSNKCHDVHVCVRVCVCPEALQKFSEAIQNNTLPHFML